jgi:hypothetical protein
MKAMDWEAIKEQSRIVYARTAQVLLFLQLVSYVVGCVVASKPLGPKDYVRFTYHVIQWSPGNGALNSTASLRGR